MTMYKKALPQIDRVLEVMNDPNTIKSMMINSFWGEDQMLTQWRNWFYKLSQEWLTKGDFSAAYMKKAERCKKGTFLARLRQLSFAAAGYNGGNESAYRLLHTLTKRKKVLEDAARKRPGMAAIGHRQTDSENGMGQRKIKA